MATAVPPSLAQANLEERAKEAGVSLPAQPVRVVVDGSPLIGPKSGVAAYASSLIAALYRLEGAIELAVFFDSLRIVPAKILQAHGLPSIPTGHFLLPKRLLRRLWSRGLLPVTAATGAADIVHSTNFAVYPVGHSRQVVMLHDVSVRQHPEWHFPKRVREMEGHLARMRTADVVLVSTDYVRQQALDDLGIPPERIHTVPLGVPAACFQIGHARVGGPMPPSSERASSAVRARYQLPAQYILFVGTIEPRKNIARLIQAFAQLPLSLRKSYPLLLAGHPGWHTAPIYAAAGALEREGTVRFLGGVSDEDLPQLYAAATLFVYPSLEEGFGLPPLEAMASGTPVIVSDAPALVEVSGPAARIVPRNDTNALAGAMADLLTNPAERERLAELGRHHAAQYTWERTARETLAVYRKVLGRD
jgi:glycosyltransferase involved in cell wall biosynthesis